MTNQESKDSKDIELGENGKNEVTINGDTPKAKEAENNADSSSNLDSGNPDQVGFIETEIKTEVIKQKRVLPKFVFLISIATLLALWYCVFNLHWFLPYYYAITYPILLTVRLILYKKYKWLYFMIDYCYFGNALVYIYMWAAPWQPQLFAVMFSVANGPLAWGSVLFKNSLVLHDDDKMVSMYIHTVPMFVSYGVRWYSNETSTYWYTDFTSTYIEDVVGIFIWVILIPFGFFMLHLALYMIIIRGPCKPGPGYLYSFQYLGKKKTGCTGWCLNHRGPKWRFPMYTMLHILFGILSTFSTPLFYKFFICHTIYMCGVILIIAWNGATFYVDVFSRKGFSS